MEHNNNYHDEATILTFCPNIQIDDTKIESIIEVDELIGTSSDDDQFEDIYYRLRFLENSKDLSGFSEIKHLSKQINYLVNKIKHYREYLDYQ